MTSLRVFVLRVRGLFGHRRRDGDLQDEIQTHLELLAAEQMRNGLSAKAAHAAARREFGGVEQTKEAYRDRRSLPVIEQVRQDLRYAGRQILKHPGFTAVVVISLALGIGANTMIFSVVNGLLLHSLPFPNPNRVVMLWFTPPNHPDQHANATYADCLALRERTQSFEHVGCMVNGSGTNVSEDGQDAALAERLIGQECTTDLTDVMGVQPLLGHWFTREDEQRGRDPMMLISYRLWQRRFAGSPDVVGRKVHVTATQSAGSDVATILGVLPERFDFFNPQVDYWFAFIPPVGAENSPSRRYVVAARLRRGVAVAQAQAEMNAVAVNLAKELPKTNRDWGIQVQPIGEAYLGSLQSPFFTLQGVVVFVLLIACANVAGLLLAQGASQQKELAIRAALGSGRGRLIRQLLTASVLLAVMGGAVGLAIGWGGMQLLVRSLPAGFPRLGEIAIDRRVLLFTMALSLTTGLVFGILPALRVSRPNLTEMLASATRGTTMGLSHQRLRSGFVVAQIALAVVLLVGAGLMINSFLRLSAVRGGFDPRSLMSFQIQFADSKFIRDTGRPTPSGSPETEVTPLLIHESAQIQERLTRVPGVTSATAVVGVAPLSGVTYGRLTFTVAGKTVTAAEEQGQSAEWYAITPHYFNTLSLPVIAGREFAEHDDDSGAPVVAINATMAKRFWPNQNPMGQVIQVGYFNDPPRQIVGIVADMRQNSREPEPQAQMYVPFAQVPRFEEKKVSYGLQVLTFIVRSTNDSAQLTSALRSAVAEIDRSQPVYNMRSIEGYASGQLDGYRQYVLMLGVFGGVAVLLAVVGIYGIMAHSVSQRTSEIGIRMALGSSAQQVLQLILGRGVLLIAGGLTLGSGAALGLTRLLRSSLWGVTATDPLTFAVVLSGLTGVALIACWIPARRALRVNPMVALRRE
jgi:putative ABC transport system permease protein